MKVLKSKHLKKVFMWYKIKELKEKEQLSDQRLHCDPWEHPGVILRGLFLMFFY